MVLVLSKTKPGHLTKLVTPLPFTPGVWQGLCHTGTQHDPDASLAGHPPTLFHIASLNTNSPRNHNYTGLARDNLNHGSDGSSREGICSAKPLRRHRHRLGRATIEWTVGLAKQQTLSVFRRSNGICRTTTDDIAISDSWTSYSSDVAGFTAIFA